MLPRFRTNLLIAFLPVMLLACQSGPPASPTATSPSDIPNITPSPTLEPSPTTAPTLTPPPTSTPRPVPTLPQSGRTIFQESFDDETTCFNVKSLEPGIELGIDDGAYRMRVEGERSYHSLCRSTTFDDFVLDIDLGIHAGDADSLAGITFRLYTGSAYSIYISGQNEFCWDFYDADIGSFRPVVGCWALLPESMQVSNSVHLRIVASGEDMAVYVDDVLLAVVQDSGSLRGTFGLLVINLSSNATEALFDNIHIRSPRPDDLNVFTDSQTG